MKKLEKRSLGNTGLDVTLMGFGALEIGRDWGLGDTDARKRPDDEAAGRVLNGVLDLGINLIDTARAYHRSEERIGSYVSGRRSEFVLASKCGEHSEEPRTYYDFSYEAIRGSIDLSLRLLQTETIDVMQIHFGPDPEKVLRDGETVRAMKDAQQAGKVRFLGASPPAHLLEACIESGDFQVLQVGYSLLDRGAEALIEQAADRGIGILIRSGLAAGALTPRVVPHLETDERLRRRVKPLLDLVGGNASRLTALAFAFLRSNAGISSILAGSKRIEHVGENLALLAAGVEPALLEEAVRLTR